MASRVSVILSTFFGLLLVSLAISFPILIVNSRRPSKTPATSESGPIGQGKGPNPVLPVDPTVTPELSVAFPLGAAFATARSSPMAIPVSVPSPPVIVQPSVSPLAAVKVPEVPSASPSASTFTAVQVPETTLAPSVSAAPGIPAVIQQPRASRSPIPVIAGPSVSTSVTIQIPATTATKTPPDPTEKNMYSISTPEDPPSTKKTAEPTELAAYLMKKSAQGEQALLPAQPRVTPSISAAPMPTTSDPTFLSITPVSPPSEEPKPEVLGVKRDIGDKYPYEYPQESDSQPEPNKEEQKRIEEAKELENKKDISLKGSKNESSESETTGKKPESEEKKDASGNASESVEKTDEPENAEKTNVPENVKESDAKTGKDASENAEKTNEPENANEGDTKEEPKIVLEFKHEGDAEEEGDKKAEDKDVDVNMKEERAKREEKLKDKYKEEKKAR